MWPFRGKAPAGQGEDTPAPVAAPVMRHEWKGMPPTQRAVGDHPLTAATDGFRDDLATQHDPSVISHFLGHHVTAEAPAGLVLAVARTTNRSDGPAMVDRPRVQRRTTTPELEPSSADAPVDGAAMAPESPPERITARTILRELPVVAFEPPIQRLTVLAPDVEPTPVGAPLPVSRLAPSGGPHEAARPEVNQADQAGSEATDPAAPAYEAPSPRLTLGQSRRLGLGAPLRQVPPTSVQRAAEAHETTTAPPRIDEVTPGPAREPAATPTSTSMPALTLAPRPMPAMTLTPTPMPESPDAAAPGPLADSGQATPEPVDAEPVRRLANAMELTAAPRLGLPLAPSVPAHDRPAQLDAVSRVGPNPAVQPGPSMPSVRAQRQHDRSAANAAASPPTPPTTSSPSIAPQPGIGPSPTILMTLMRGSEPRAGEIARGTSVAPIAGRRPRLPGAPVQRSTEAVPPALHEPIGRAFGTDLSDARLDRTDQAAAEATSLQALAFTRGDTVALPSTHGSILATPQRALLAHELTHVAQQRRYGSALPAEGSPAGRRLELQAQAVERSVGRDSTLRLAPVAGAVAIQRAVAQVESSTHRVEPSDAQPVVDWGANVQRADSESIAVGAPLGETVDARDPATPAAPSNSGSRDHGSGEKAMDELATKLYDKIRSRLKAELLVDRERAGFLTDLR